MKHCLSLVAWAAAVLLLAGCSRHQPRTFAYTQPDGTVKLISFNLRNSNSAKKDGDDRWENRREAVLNMLEAESPSVVGVQEGCIDQVKYIEANCPQFSRIGVGRDDGAEGGEMMAVFYRNDRFDAIDAGTFWLSETPDKVSRGWDAACNRTATWVQLSEQATGKSFYYLNTHFDHKGPRARAESARMVAEWIASLPAGATVIVGGDLNADCSDPLFDPMKEVASVGREIAEPTDRGGTFNGFGSAPDNIVLDHIFCRNVGPASLSVLRGNYGAPFISDHYPVVFTFGLP